MHLYKPQNQPTNQPTNQKKKNQKQTNKQKRYDGPRPDAKLAGTCGGGKGGPITLQKCIAGNSSQIWSFKKDGKSIATSAGLCLDIDNYATTKVIALSYQQFSLTRGEGGKERERETLREREDPDGAPLHWPIPVSEQVMVPPALPPFSLLFMRARACTPPSRAFCLTLSLFNAFSLGSNRTTVVLLTCAQFRKKMTSQGL